MKKRTVDEMINESISVKKNMLSNAGLIKVIGDVAGAIVKTFRSGGKVLLCGNGGSAADAQHIAAELSGKFMLNREPLFAEALHVNTSYLTATANDSSFEEVYSRLVKAQGVNGDVLIGISTSGNSANVLHAMKEARKKGMIRVGMTGVKKSKLDRLSDYLIKVPSGDTARIQEAHILIGHIICELVERDLFA
jgi:D-sedoheptulose 7-phosphate isomerase